MKHLLYAYKLLSQYMGNSWLRSYSSLFSSYRRLHSNQNPSFNGNCVQQTPTLHSSPPSKQEYVKRVIPTFQEVECDIILRNAQLKAPRRQEELQTHIQAHLLSVVKKMPFWSIRMFSPLWCTLLPSAHNTLSGSWLDILSHALSSHLVKHIFSSTPIHHAYHPPPSHPLNVLQHCEKIRIYICISCQSYYLVTYNIHNMFCTLLRLYCRGEVG